MKKRWKILIGIVLFLVILNFALEPVAEHYVNKALGNLENYDGSIQDIDIHLWRGAYKVDSLEVVKTDGEFREPFVSIATIDISLEWPAIFRGAIVGSIALEKPVVNFTINEESQSQSGEDEDWQKTIDELIPISINRFEIVNGKVFFKDYSSSPQVEMNLYDLDMLVTNLSTVRNKDKKLPSHMNLNAKTSGEGLLIANMDLNPLKETPDFDFELELTQLQLSYLKDFTEAYANFEFKEGRLDVFTEAAMDNGTYEGYVKPLLKDIRVINLDNPETSFWRKAWQVVVGTTFEVFENQPKDQVATKVPFEGNMQNSDVGVLATLANVIRNAFIDAFEGQIDQSVNIEGVNKEDEEEDKGFFDFLKSDDDEEK